MKIKNIFKNIAKIFRKNFQYKITQPELSRTESFLRDSTIQVTKSGRTWSAIGKDTGYCYKDGMSETGAGKYVSELNNNKKNL